MKFLIHLCTKNIYDSLPPINVGYRWTAETKYSMGRHNFISKVALAMQHHPLKFPSYGPISTFFKVIFLIVDDMYDQHNPIWPATT